MRWILIAIFATAALTAASQSPAVEDRVRDRFRPTPYQRQKIEGLLGRRMAVNLEGRLLHVNEEALLAGFEKRPGTHPWIGEHAGKYLHAAVNTWLYAQDERLHEQMDRIARRLIAAQLPDGYLGTYTDDKRWTSWDVWVHKYDLLGLLAYYEATGYKPALAASRAVGDLLCRTFGDGPGQLDIVKSSTHVGMAAMSVLEPMVMLYRHTGERRYLDFCLYIVRAYDQPNGPKIIRSLASTGSVFKTANAKAYEMMSNLVGLVDVYRITGDEKYLAPAITAWNDIAAKRLYITGTTSSKEHFTDDFDLPGDEAAKVGEGCATVTWLQLSWQLLRVTGEPKYAQELERTVYNQLLGAQDPHNGNICYFTPLVGKKAPGPGINCCVSSEPRGISMIPQMVTGELDKGVAILLYAPGRATVGNVELSFQTAYPADGNVKLTIDPGSTERFPLYLRVPRWTARYTAVAGGRTWTGKPGEFLVVDREWKSGDTVSISMDMTVRVLEGGKSYPGQVAIQRGPQVLALEVSLNPASPANAATLGTAAAKDLRLNPAPGALPADWGGDQAYTVDTRGGRPLVLVPFSDAREMSTWLRVN